LVRGQWAAKILRFANGVIQRLRITTPGLFNGLVIIRFIQVFFVKMNKTRVCAGEFILLCLCVLLNVSAQSGFVSTRGHEILGPDGKPLILRGINLGNWLVPEGYMFRFKTANSPRLVGEVINELIGDEAARHFWKSWRENYVTEDDIRFIKSSGLNSVRIPFNYRLFVTDTEPRRFEGPGYELLDHAIEMCRKHGLLVVLDMHAAPGGQTGDNIDDSWGYPFIFDSSESQDLAVEVWKKLAGRYRNDKTVAGYDLLNEPIPNYLDESYFNPKLEPLYRKIVAGVREVDRNHLLFLGGAQWDSNFKVFGKPFDQNVAYTFHKYWVDVKPDIIRDYVDFRNKYDVPIWLGESGENTDEWIAKFRSLLEENQIGWCFWPYKKLEAASCMATVKAPEDWSAITGFAEQSRRTFEEIRKARPAREKIEKTLADLLEAVKFRNCRVNPGYLNALGHK
jgi:endoglucanase